MRKEGSKMRKDLVVYYSHSGNTKKAANMIADLRNADVIELVPKEAYPTGLWDVVEIFKKDIASDGRREINPYSINMEDYDTVFIGTPNWGDTFATPLLSFFDVEDLKEKRIAPFVTHGGGGVGRCADDIIKYSGSNESTKPLVYKGGSVTKSNVETWLDKI